MSDSIPAIDLGRFKSVACVYSRSRWKVTAKVTPRKSDSDVREVYEPFIRLNAAAS